MKGFGSQFSRARLGERIGASLVTHGNMWSHRATLFVPFCFTSWKWRWSSAGRRNCRRRGGPEARRLTLPHETWCPGEERFHSLTSLARKNKSNILSGLDLRERSLLILMVAWIKNAHQHVHSLRAQHTSISTPAKKERSGKFCSSNSLKVIPADRLLLRVRYPRPC